MTKDRRWFYIAILSLIVAILWLTVSAVARLRKSTIPQDVAKVARPLDPNIDRSIFTILEKRR